MSFHTNPTPKMPPPPPPPPNSRLSRSSHRSISKTKILINVYDLLPPGRLATVVWTLGIGLLHSGVVVGDREYAFGGHDKKNMSGVYWMTPRTDPPGGTWRCELLHGFTYATEEEIEEIVNKASREFLGPSYNLLTRNCNHFTSYLCQALTGVPAPAFLNRAASIGVALPCVVPANWIEPPECEVNDHDEGARLTGNAAELGGRDKTRHSLDAVWQEESSGADYTSDDSEEEAERNRRRERRKKKKGKGRPSGDIRDEEGRQLPQSERVRVDRTVGVQ